MEFAVKQSRFPSENDVIKHESYSRTRGRRFFILAVVFHVLLFVPGMLALNISCLGKTPAGVPMGKGKKLTAGKVVIKVQKKVLRKRRVRKSPVSIYEQMKDMDEQADKEAKQQFSDNVGVPGAVGSGAAAAGSPQGTELGAKLYFYRLKLDCDGWDANRAGVGPFMTEVEKAGVVKKVERRFNNIVALKDLPKHSGEYFPALLYLTGTGAIRASDQEVQNLQDYLKAGGMLFADASGGNFEENFKAFMRRVLPGVSPTNIEFDHEIYRGANVPYALVHGCPIYRHHGRTRVAQGWFLGPKIAVFYCPGDLGSAWATGGLFAARKDSVKMAFRMGVNIVAYSLLYYKVTDQTQ